MHHSRTLRAAGAIHPHQTVAERWYSEKRLTGLSRFAIAITILNVLGHTVLGFEQSWITPIVAVGAAYLSELVGETLEAWAGRRLARYRGGVGNAVMFLLPAHISGLAIGMLLYAADNVAAIAFAASVAIGSKYILRVVTPTGASRHVLNPSNFGITVTLLLFPTVGIAPPYQFTENTSGIVDLLLPLVIIGTGSYLNIKATGRVPLIQAWVAMFALQAVARAMFHGTPMFAGLVPMTGFAFILFTFYMVTDPATTPAKTRNQICFGAAVALAYALCMELHVVFGLFYALTLVTAGRGAWILLEASLSRRSTARAAREVGALEAAE
jgi:enediyne biosynthesis protein E5